MEIFTVHLGPFINPKGLTQPVVIPSYWPLDRKERFLDLLVSGLGNPRLLRLAWREIELEPHGNRIVVNGVTVNTEDTLLLVGVTSGAEFRASAKMMPRVPALLVAYDALSDGFVQYQAWLHELNNMLVKAVHAMASQMLGEAFLREFDFPFVLHSLSDPLDILEFMNRYVEARGQGLAEREAIREAFGGVVAHKVLQLQEPDIGVLLRLTTMESSQTLPTRDLGEVDPDSLRRLEEQGFVLISGQKLFLHLPTLRLREVDLLEKAVNLVERQRPLEESRKLYEAFLQQVRQPAAAPGLMAAERGALAVESRMEVSLAEVEARLREHGERLGIEIDTEDVPALKALVSAVLKDERRAEKRALAVMARAYTHLKEGDLDRGWQDAGLAYRTDPALQDAYLTVVAYAADWSVTNWQLSDAVEYYRAWLAEDPRAWRAYHGLGEAHWKRGEWDRATDFYRRALAEAHEARAERGAGAILNNLGLVNADKGEWGRAVEFYQKSLDLEKRLGDVHGLAMTYMNLGSVYARKGEWDQAIEFYQKSLDLEKRLGDVHGLAQTYNNLGLVYADKGEWDRAVELYQKSLDIEKKMGDVHGLAGTYNNLGLIYADKGEWGQAIEFYQKSLDLKERLGDVHGLATTYMNLGLVYDNKGEWDRAVEFYLKSLDLSQKLGDGHGLAQTYNNLGLVYADKGERDRAIEFYQKSLDLSQKLGDIHGLAGTYNNLGLVYTEKGQWDQAIKFHQKAEATFEKLGDVHGLARTYGNLGNVYADEGQWDQAIEFYRKDLAMSEKLGDVHGLAQTYGNLGNVHRHKGEWDKALELYRQTEEIMERLGDAHGLAIAYNNIGLVYEQQGRVDEAREMWEKALEVFQRLGAPEAEKVLGWLEALDHGGHGGNGIHGKG